MKTQYQKALVVALIGALVLLSGCHKVYYSTMEAFGKHKRDILVEDVTKARDAQNEAKEQFSSALEEFSAVINFSGGDLEEKYKILDNEYKKSKSKADAVSNRINNIKHVAMALFEEWEKEIDLYTSENLRKVSETKLKDTQQRYTKLIMAMEKAESKIQPVLSAFQDQVLFLKHNLNAQAVASLQDELSSVESEIAILIAEMERSIQEADVFIHEMTQADSPASRY